MSRKINNTSLNTIYLNTHKNICVINMCVYIHTDMYVCVCLCVQRL